MSIARSLAVFATCAAVGLAAASAQAATASSHHSAPSHVVDQAHDAKRAACEKVWTAQKIRHGTRQAFVAACVAKG